MSSTLPPPDYAALVRAVDSSCDPCRCGYLVRLGMQPRCDNCCQKIALLADLLARESVTGKATVVLWSEWKECLEVFRLTEPIR